MTFNNSATSQVTNRMQSNDSKHKLKRGKTGSGTIVFGLFWLGGVIAALAAIVAYSNYLGKAESVQHYSPGLSNAGDGRL